MNRVFVFTSCYRQEAYLQGCVASVASQTYRDFCHLVVNDPIGAGVGRLLNEAIRVARDVGCEYFVWMPADDLAEPNLLSEKAEAASHHPHAVIYSRGTLIDEYGQDHGSVCDGHMTPAELRDAIRTRCPIAMTGVWIPMSAFERVGTFPGRQYSEDFHWIVRACQAGVDFVHVEKTLFKKRIHDQRTTARYADKVAGAADEIRKELGYV